MKIYYSLIMNGKEADIYVFGDITSWEYFENDVSSYTLSQQLKGLDVDVINVHINSYGGEVAEGLAIYNSLKNHKAKVITICDGFACSAASVVFMAGDERRMNNASLLMIHNAWTYASGNSTELRKAADDLEVISKGASAAYLEKINISETELSEMLEAETWILPADAVEMGFATSIISSESTEKAAASARNALFKMLTQAKEPKASIDPKEMAKAVYELIKADTAKDPEPVPQVPQSTPKNNLLKLFGAL